MDPVEIIEENVEEIEETGNEAEEEEEAEEAGVVFKCSDGEEIVVNDRDILSQFTAVVKKVEENFPNWENEAEFFSATISLEVSREIVEFVLSHVSTFPPRPADAVHMDPANYPGVADLSPFEKRFTLEVASDLGNEKMVDILSTFVASDLESRYSPEEIIQFLGIDQ